MPDCSKCRQTVNPDAVTCPTCRTPLKAFGHPGIPLYQASGDTPLCQTCTYDADDSCNYPQRPHAQNCTMYQKIGITRSPFPKASKGLKSQATAHYAKFPNLAWWRQNPAWLWLSGLFLVILLVKVVEASR